MLTHFHEDKTPVQNSLSQETLVGKHCWVVFLVPVFILIICIIITVIKVDKRFVLGGWLIFCVSFYHYAIERLELYYYGFSENGITVYDIMGTKKRIIPWSQIIQIGVRRGRNTAGMLIITILGAPKWNPAVKYRHQTWYYLSNRPNVIMIEKWKQAERTIIKYYGAFDY